MPAPSENPGRVVLVRAEADRGPLYLLGCIPLEETGWRFPVKPPGEYHVVQSIDTNHAQEAAAFFAAAFQIPIGEWVPLSSASARFFRSYVHWKWECRSRYEADWFCFVARETEREYES